MHAPLRPTRYAKRRRVEPIEASEPELEAVAVQTACEAALLCHETVTTARFEKCTNLLVDGDQGALCTNPKSASSQVSARHAQPSSHMPVAAVTSSRATRLELNKMP